MRTIAALLLFAVAGKCAPAPTEAGEYQLKAAFLLSFTRFVEWPAESLERDAPLPVCVYGADPFGGALDRTVSGRFVGFHVLQIRHAAKIEDLRPCRVVFLAASESKRFRQVLQSIAGYPVLTIGEGDGFLGAGGMISLIVENRKIRFDVNSAAARSAGLRISSKLLALARRVSGE